MRSIRCIAIRALEMRLNKSALNDNIHIRIVAAFFDLFCDVNNRGEHERTRKVLSIGPHGRTPYNFKKITP